MSEAESCRAILAQIADSKPRPVPMREIQLLAALGTIKPAAGGRIEAGRDLLLSITGMDLKTYNLARDGLVASGRVEYHAGRGRGHVTWWEIHAPVPVPVLARDARKRGEGRTADQREREPFPAAKRGEGRAEKGGGLAVKGSMVDSLTSDDPNTVYKDSVHRDSVHLSQRGLSLLDQLRAAVPGADLGERELMIIREKLTENGARSPDAVIKARIADGTAAALADECLNEHAALSPADRAVRAGLDLAAKYRAAEDSGYWDQDKHVHTGGMNWRDRPAIPGGFGHGHPGDSACGCCVNLPAGQTCPEVSGECDRCAHGHHHGYCGQCPDGPCSSRRREPRETSPMDVPEVSPVESRETSPMGRGEYSPYS